jgi:hypothetical protein
MVNYKSKKIVDRLKWVIVDEDGKVINNNPTKEELKGLEKEPKENYKIRRAQYTEKELLDILRQFYEKYGRPPTVGDFRYNSEYPSISTYISYFGSWSAALKLVGLDVDSMVKKGIVETENQKARFSEIIIRDNFDNPSIDLAGENCLSPCDGICPNGKTYDVKSSKLYDTHYAFSTKNKHKDEIEIYYLLGFNEDYTKLDYGWRIPGEIIESDNFYIGLNPSHEFDVEDMEKYDITDELREILIKNGYFEKIENYRKAREKGMTIFEYDKQLYDGCITL